MPRKTIEPHLRLPWEAAPGESPVAYESFVVYRDMGPRRTLTGAYRKEKQQPDASAPGGAWEKWFKRWQWRDRAAAYDAFLDEKKVQAAAHEKQKLARHEIRTIEISARNTLLETASLAHADIADVVSWDGEGKITVKPSDELPPHVTGAISKFKQSYDKQGKPTIEVEMHPKVRPLDLLGQHFSLWDSEKKQEERTATNTFLELLAAVKSGQLRGAFPPSMLSINNPPPGVVIETEAALIPPQADMEKLKEEL